MRHTHSQCRMTGNSRLVLRHLEQLRDASTGQDEARVVVQKPDADKRTPLHWAASSGLSVEAVRALCDCGADLNARDASGWTPLMIAASAGRADIVAQLLYLGADALAANPRGQTALHYAASKGHVDVARQLLVNGPGGADVNARDGAKQCPLYVERHDDLRDWLLTNQTYHTIDIERPPQEMTPLYVCFSNLLLRQTGRLARRQE